MAKFTPAANATTRFSSRVDAYVRYRPGYPAELYQTLCGEFGLVGASVIADVGSGTGISSEQFLKHGHTVYAVEPNLEMREAAERLLAKYPTFRSVDGRAEATTLPDASVDWVTAGQAFHWFDVPRARAEFRRILRLAGRVALFWNVRREDTPFLLEYEQLLKQFATDYSQVKHQNAESDGRIEDFFGGTAGQRRAFANRQVFDFDGLRGRTLSSSYMPGTDDPGHVPMLAALRQIFDRHSERGCVAFEYVTRLYVGP